MQLTAPAKINLHLRVAPVNADGFHPLLSWMCTVGLFDILTFDVSPVLSPGLSPVLSPVLSPGLSPASSPSRSSASSPASSFLTLTCDDPALACDESNLIRRAAAAMDHRTGSIHLQKRIPTGGGLGGGSSDAACTLMGLNRLLGPDKAPRKSPAELAAIGATLGSDVPFFCHGPSGVCTGRGEIVRPIARPTPPWALLILPSLAMPTAPVYRRFDELLTESDRERLNRAVADEPDWAQWSSLPAASLLPLLINDLERPAFDLNPRLAACRADVEQFLGRVVRMSGSGSSLFTLYDDRPNAERAASTLDGSKRPDGISLRVLVAPLAPEGDAATGTESGTNGSATEFAQGLSKFRD